jgi:hypothetical protein
MDGSVFDTSRHSEEGEEEFVFKLGVEQVCFPLTIRGLGF